MKEINSETLISSLFVIGFEKVDFILFTLVLGSLSKNIKFNDNMLSAFFNKYIYFDGFSYYLKDGITLSTNVSETEGYVKTLEQALSKNNEELISILRNIDFKKIISRKMELLRKEIIEDDDLLFCEHEREIMLGKRDCYERIDFPYNTSRTRDPNPVSIHEIARSIDESDGHLQRLLEKYKSKPNPKWPPLWHKK